MLANKSRMESYRRYIENNFENNDEMTLNSCKIVSRIGLWNIGFTSNANKIGKASIPIVNRSILLTGPWGLKTMGYEAVYGAGRQQIKRD